MKQLASFALAGLLIVATGSAVAASERPEWWVAASAYFYFVPFDENYVQPTVSADRDHLHFELRYNYEGLNTASAWAGYNLAVGSEVWLVFTPMLGGVFGGTVGVAPGYRASLGWRRLEMSSESEYLFDAEEDDDSFFYSWSELTFTFATWMSAGIAIQRTQAYESAREIQRGFVLGAELDRWGAACYVFDPDKSDPTYVLSAYAEF